MQFTYDLKDCACKSATVYLDRAEVSRVVKVTAKEGENEVLINNLSEFIDEDSLRFVLILCKCWTACHTSIPSDKTGDTRI